MKSPAQVNRKKGGLQRALLAWYRQSARDLPWRRTRDPYRIWLAEIMTQQTRVETVLAYYERFTKALPRVRDLAAARIDRCASGSVTRQNTFHSDAPRLRAAFS